MNATEAARSAPVSCVVPADSSIAEAVNCAFEPTLKEGVLFERPLPGQIGHHVPALYKHDK